MHALKRLSLGLALIAGLAVLLLASDWQSRRSRGDRGGTEDRSGEPFRLAILQHASQPVLDDGVEGMLRGLAERGFVEGVNIAVRRFNAEGDLATANAIAKSITGGGYDMVLTASTLSLQAVANANRAGKTRHVFSLVTDPVAAGVGAAATIRSTTRPTLPATGPCNRR